jgi:hypothetical protein
MIKLQVLLFFLQIVAWVIASNLTMSKAFLPYKAAKNYCKEMGWKLSRGDQKAIEFWKGATWVRAPVKDGKDLPVGRKLYYKKKKGLCCAVSRNSARCSKNTCNLLAPALCQSS